MSKTALEAAFDDFRPRISYKVTSPLQTLLGTHEIKYAQARWSDPSSEHDIEVDVFTATHWFNAKLADATQSPAVRARRLVFSEVQSDGDDWTITLDDHTIELFRSAPSYFGGDKPARSATTHPEEFIKWAVTHGTWA